MKLGNNALHRLKERAQGPGKDDPKKPSEVVQDLFLDPKNQAKFRSDIAKTIGIPTGIGVVTKAASLAKGASAINKSKKANKILSAIAGSKFLKRADQALGVSNYLRGK